VRKKCTRKSRKWWTYVCMLLKSAGNAKCWLRRKFFVAYDNKKKRVVRNCGKRQVNARLDSCIYGPRESQHCFFVVAHISRENFSRDGALVTREFYLQSRRGYDHNCWQTPSLTRRCYILSRYTYNRYLENSLHNTSLELVAYVHQASTLNSYIRCVYMLLIFL